MDQPITVSYLTTQADYVNFKTAAAKAVAGKHEAAILHVTGCGLVFAALILRIFYSRSFLQNVVCIVMAIVGVIVGALYESIARSFIRGRAFNEFEANKNRFIALTAGFDEEKITLKTDRYTAALPYALFYKAYEDDKVFILYTGIDEMRFIPKRAISEQECEQIQSILRRMLKEKYQQEGAR